MNSVPHQLPGRPTEYRTTFVATEGELVAGGAEAVVWQQCRTGLGDNPPVRIAPDEGLYEGPRLGELAGLEEVAHVLFCVVGNPGGMTTAKACFRRGAKSIVKVSAILISAH